MTNENGVKEVSKNFSSAVANQHLGKCVKCALTNIWAAKSQIVMVPRSGKHGFVNSSLHFEKNKGEIDFFANIWSLN